MPKNKQKRAAKKRQTRALKAARRRKGIRAKLDARRRQKAHLEGPANFDIDAIFPEPEYRFWLAHGANYLASDYHNGNWTPLFPELYTGRLYEPEELVQKTLAHFETHGDEAGAQKRIVAWLLTERHLIWGFKAGMAHRILNANLDGDPVEILQRPRVGILWEGFSQVFDAAGQGDLE